MGAALGGVLPEAIAVAISPIPIIAVVLLLSSAKGGTNALAFLLAWLIGLAVMGTIVLLVAHPGGDASDNGRPSWVGWLLLGVGVVVVLLGFRRWAHRPKGGETPPMPKWMKAIDRFGAARSAAMGFVLAAVNPKNTTLTLAAAAAIATAGLSTGDAFLVLAVFVLIGTLGLAVPFVIYLLGGDRAAATLDRLHRWLALHNTTIMAVLFVVIGAKLIANGLQILL